MLNEASPVQGWSHMKFNDYSLLINNSIRTTLEENCVGYLRKIVQCHFDVSGKMVRPYVAYRLGSIMQVPVEALVAWSTTCELLHNATLIHDDIQDRDTYRRGTPTLWKRFGDAQAINAGDFLMLSALQPTLQSQIPASVKNELMSLYSKMACKIASGQSLEFELSSLNFPDLIYQKYFQCINLKTAALFSDLAVGVCWLSENPRFNKEDINQLFSQIGILFQMQDDIIDLYGNKKRDTRGCDIKEGKISFLVAMHIHNHPEDFEYLKSILEKPRLLTDESDIANVDKLFEQKQTLTFCQNRIAELQENILNLEVVRKSGELNELVSELLQMFLTHSTTKLDHVDT